MSLLPLPGTTKINFYSADLLLESQEINNLAQTILEGVALEAKNSSNEKIFHQILQSFNFTNILVQRSLDLKADDEVCGSSCKLQPRFVLQLFHYFNEKINAYGLLIAPERVLMQG